MKQSFIILGLSLALFLLLGAQEGSACYGYSCGYNYGYNYGYSSGYVYSYTPTGWNWNAPGTWASGQSAIEHWPAQWIGHYDYNSPSHQRILSYNQYTYYANSYPRHWHGSPYGWGPYITPDKRWKYY